MAIPSEGDPTWGVVVERLRTALANEFEIDGELGHGGMAAVFRARDLALNRRVAIKVMAPGLLLGEGMVERFRQEAITVANLQHANIVAVYGVRTVGDLHLFVMQYIPGRSLDRVLRDHGRLSLQAVRAVMYHVGSALDYAHRRGVVHRDIKPGNIILDGDGDPVVTDFGIAKIAETPGYTRVGTVVGTPTYMSPEQCMGYDVGPASDQYALGVVAYEMLTGRPPFVGSGMAMMRAHTEQPPDQLRAARTDIPEFVDAAVMRMLAKKPEDRFPDLAAAMEALEAHPLSALGPTRAEMAALAGAMNAETHLADIVKAPRSPVPAVVPAAVAAIEVDAPVDVRAGTRTMLSARAVDRRGATVQTPITWSSRNPTVAAVTEQGSLTPRRRGTAVVVAEAGGIARAVTITVTVPPVVEVVVDGVPPALVVGASATLRGVVRTARAADDTEPRSVEWRSSNPAVATVSGDGVVTARAPGQAVISATCEAIRGTATVNAVSVRAATVVVTAPGTPLRLGDEVALKATVYDASGNVISRPVTWRSTDAHVAPVDQSGRFVARAEGWAIVTAQADGRDAHTEVLVRQQLIPVSARGKRELRRLALRWWILLAVVAGAVALGWRLLRH
jgi:eukaryotic-like serine/threonine-protein kinase